MDSCEFRYNATGDDFITMIDIDAFDDAYISNCVFHAEETAGCSEAIRMDDALRTKIINCHFTGDFTDKGAENHEQRDPLEGLSKSFKQQGKGLLGRQSIGNPKQQSKAQQRDKRMDFQVWDRQDQKENGY